MDAVVYLNGDFIPAEEARISPFDHGFLYGYGLYETCRSYNGVIFRLAQHLKRLLRAAELLGLDATISSIGLESTCLELLKVNKLENARIRITVSAGPGDIIPESLSGSCSTVFIAARKLVLPAPDIYKQGYQVFTSNCRRNSRSLLAQIKSTCCLESLLALQEANARGGDDVIILNEKGMLTEASTANIFLVKNGVLETPTCDSGALPGITGEVVGELAQAMGIRVVRKEIPGVGLSSADEVFRTSSILEIIPITRVDGKPVGNRKPGPITNKISLAYRELVQQETRS